MSVVVFTPDVVGRRMAGPGIRAFHFAAELATSLPTTLVAKLDDYNAAALDARADPSLFASVDSRGSDARDVLRSATVIVSQPHREIFSVLGPKQKIAWDLFDPVVLEMLEINGSGIRHRVHFEREWRRLRRALGSGDLRIHATPSQRDFYTGVHTTEGSIEPGWNESWVEVPFGVEDVDPGAAAPDPLATFVWGGGLWDWLDPDTAVAATRLAAAAGFECRLHFLGVTRPDDVTSETSRARLRSLLTSAGDLVTQNREWTAYRDRATTLLAARGAIMLHRKTLESRYSIRTRFFDALWCSLPVIATEGGYASDLIAAEGLGITVVPGDVSGVAKAMQRLIEDDGFHASCVRNIDRIRPRFLWSRVTRPLLAAIERMQTT